MILLLNQRSLSCPSSARSAAGTGSHGMAAASLLSDWRKPESSGSPGPAAWMRASAASSRGAAGISCAMAAKTPRPATVPARTIRGFTGQPPPGAARSLARRAARQAGRRLAARNRAGAGLHAQPVQPAEPGRVEQRDQGQDDLADHRAVGRRVRAVQDREDREPGHERHDPAQRRAVLRALSLDLTPGSDVPGQDLRQRTEHAVHRAAPLTGGDDQGGGDPVASGVVDLGGERAQRVLGPGPRRQPPGERRHRPGDRGRRSPGADRERVFESAAGREHVRQPARPLLEPFELRGPPPGGSRGGQLRQEHDRADRRQRGDRPAGQRQRDQAGQDRERDPLPHGPDPAGCQHPARRLARRRRSPGQLGDAEHDPGHEERSS